MIPADENARVVPWLVVSRTLIGAEEALSLVLQHALLADESERPAAAAAGHVLSRAVVADRDYPPFDRSVMDGYAVRLSHRGRTVDVRGEARPGVVAASQPGDEACVEIMTGAPCPPGTEAVVMKEEVTREGARATFPATIAPGQNIVRRASERAEGSVVLPAGARVTPIALGLLSFVGAARVWTRPVPSLAILVTGDEVAQGTPGGVEIRDSNGPMLAAMASSFGARASVRHVRDTREALAEALEEAAAADVVVLTGGVSAGTYDLVPAAVAAHGARIVFHKVRQQPGKPLLFATQGKKLFFGLPGTPLGCHLGFERYVLSAMGRMAGLEKRPTERGRLTVDWAAPSGRQQFVLVHAARAGEGWSLTPCGPRGSSDLFTAWNANAYVGFEEGTRNVRAGEAVAFDWLAGSP
jgi:molybdopterin molybdotransferase